MTEPVVTIRALALSDAETIQGYASDERVARTTTIPEPYPADGGRMFVEQGLKTWRRRVGFSFAIVADDEMVGVVEERSCAAVPAVCAGLARICFREDASGTTDSTEKKKSE